MNIPDLQTALVNLLHAVRADDLGLIVGGGYGIYLKHQHVRTTGVRTLLEEWPEIRSTNDLDLFLRPELLMEPARLKPLAAALKSLGYQVVPSAEHYQFVKPGPEGGQAGSLKVDLLTGPRSWFDGTPARFDDRRVRPQPSVGVHAHHVDEALTLEEGLTAVQITGRTSDNIEHSETVHLPHPLTFAMMKLFAFRDRFDDADKDFGRYHALDLYSVLALASEAEWKEAGVLSARYRQTPVFEEASRIVDRYFSTLTSDGMLRMRESPYCRPELQLDDFVSALGELFPIAIESRGQ